MKLAEILTGPETWCQGALSRGDRHCLLGGLLRLEDVGAYHQTRERQRIGAVIRDLFGLSDYARVGNDEITWWNDHSERTWDEIAAVVDAYDRDRLLNP